MFEGKDADNDDGQEYTMKVTNGIWSSLYIMLISFSCYYY